MPHARSEVGARAVDADLGPGMAPLVAPLAGRAVWLTYSSVTASTVGSVLIPRDPLGK